jgi:hypothetical protein
VVHRRHDQLRAKEGEALLEVRPPLRQTRTHVLHA